MLAYLLTNDAGLSPVDAGRILHRRSATVNRLSASVEQIIGTDDARSELVAHARRLFRNGITSGKRYPPPPRRPSTSGELLVGLRVRRRMSNLTQPQLAARAGIARETLSRLERLKRRAQPETVKALARALNVAPDRLTDSR
ncbi:MAG: helix-turn-helix transcriptional regulator, partial [Chloroflexi bacterium]|nr:helix-turn-helix transcriptional regulator [Chloroflexota bacterium]